MLRQRLFVCLILPAAALGCAPRTASTRPEVAQALEQRPRFSYAETVGCGDVFFHAINAGRTEFLQIEAVFEATSAKPSVTVFDLSRRSPGVKVSVTVYSRPQVNRPNCSDVIVRQIGGPPLVEMIWPAVRGRLVIERGPAGINPDEPWLFQAKVRLEGAVFRGPDGTGAEMRSPFSWEGQTGWYAGT